MVPGKPGNSSDDPLAKGLSWGTGTRFLSTGLLAVRSADGRKPHVPGTERPERTNGARDAQPGGSGTSRPGHDVREDTGGWRRRSGRVVGGIPASVATEACGRCATSFNP
ncbi:hypothetical protein GCM10010275_38070 [Streptomyces litmocidini]|nr:hypothetical protein GCM10010275_38070 [Streptomyces litmocidini]